MYSSAVRRLSVRSRQSPTIVSPSNRPNLTLVLLALMASSIESSPLCRRVEYVAGGHQAMAAIGQFQIERPAGIQCCKPPGQRRPFQPHLDGLAETLREFEPALAHR